MPKNKVHKGLLKRIKISKTGKVKYKTCASSHLKSHKSANTLLRLRKRKTAASPEAKRFSKLLHRRLRGRDQPLSSIRRSPSPEQKRAMREAAAAAQA